MSSATDHGIEEGYLDCTHCGLCLSSCPTYRVLGSEMDSPRGRIYLMRAFDEGRAALTDTFVEHMFRCLDCRACETACPSGVHFGHMMEQMRGTIVDQRSTDPISRFVLNHVFPYPGRFHLAARLLQIYRQSGVSDFLRSTGLLKKMAPRYAAAEEMAPLVDVQGGVQPGTVYRTMEERRGAVAFFSGCVMNSLLGRANRATVELLNCAGFDVVVPEGQICCGALANHAGLRQTASEMARDECRCVSFRGCGRPHRQRLRLWDDVDGISPVGGWRGESFREGPGPVDFSDIDLDFRGSDGPPGVARGLRRSLPPDPCSGSTPGSARLTVDYSGSGTHRSGRCGRVLRKCGGL